jgi:hypothetical protein
MYDYWDEFEVVDVEDDEGEEEYFDSLDSVEDDAFTAFGPEINIKLIMESNIQTSSINEHLCIKTRKSEINFLINNMRLSCGKSNKAETTVDLSDVIDVYFGPINVRSNVELFKIIMVRLNNCTPNVESWEIYGLLEALTLLHMYQISPSMLWENSPGIFVEPILSFSRFKCFMTEFNRQDDNHASTWESKTTKSKMKGICDGFKKLALLSNELAYMEGFTTISIDDEKLRIKSQEVRELGMATQYQRGGSPGPHLILGVSKNTRVLLSAELQQYKENVAKCAWKALECK